MDTNLLNILTDIIDTHTTESMIDYVAQELRSNGLNKSVSNLIFANHSMLKQIGETEIICVVGALYKATKDERINPSKWFSQEQLLVFKKAKEESFFTPTSLGGSRYLDENDHMMLDFLNTTYGNWNTKNGYYFCYSSKIKPEENELKKNLGEFYPWEIVTLMQGLKGSMNAKNSTLTLVTHYLKWYWKDSPQDNPMLDIDRKSTPLIITNKKLIANTYVPFDELQNALHRYVTIEDNTITPLDAMIASLIRDGVTVKQVANLKYDDFNYDKNTVKIKSDSFKMMKLSPETVEWVQEARDDIAPIGRKKIVLKSIDGYIVKTELNTYTEEQAIKNIKRRLTKFAKAGYKTINENILITSKKVDMLDKIAEQNGVVRKEDFVKVQECFGNKGSSWFKIRTDYEAMRGREKIRL